MTRLATSADLPASLSLPVRAGPQDVGPQPVEPGHAAPRSSRLERGALDLSMMLIGGGAATALIMGARVLAAAACTGS